MRLYFLIVLLISIISIGGNSRPIIFLIILSVLIILIHSK